MAFSREEITAVIRDAACPSTHLFHSDGARTIRVESLQRLVHERLNREIHEHELDEAVRLLGGRRTTVTSLDNLSGRIARRLRGKANPLPEPTYELPAQTFEGLELPVHWPGASMSQKRPPPD